MRGPEMKHHHCTHRFAAAAAALLLSAAAWAMDLNQAKSAGWVCEQGDGYLRVAKPGAPNDVPPMVNNINSQRRAAYADIATKNNVAVEQVARLTAQKVIKQAPQHACR